MKDIVPIGRDIAATFYQIEGFAQNLENRRQKAGGDMPLDNEERRKAEVGILQTEALGRSLNLQHTVMAAVQIRENLRVGLDDKVADILTRFRSLSETLLRDLFTPLFLPATADMIEYMDKKEPFGGEVERVFTDSSEDLSEAHKCFAFERYTASMFHLGRAMERAVKQFAIRINATVPKDDTWQAWLSAIHVVIDPMPYNSQPARDARAPYCEAAAYFLHFKEAWRNPTAHPKKTYTREEAIDVLKGARSFMDSIARHFFK